MAAFAASTIPHDCKVSDGKYISVGLDYLAASGGCKVKTGDIMVIANANGTGTIGGLAYPATPTSDVDWTTTREAANDIFAGVAVESKTATGRYSPAIATGFNPGNIINSVRVATRGEFEFACSGFALTDVGGKAWASGTNAHTVTNAETLEKACPIGIITWVNSTGDLCRVYIAGFTPQGLAS
jgi:hypothetical protein